MQGCDGKKLWESGVCEDSLFQIKINCPTGVKGTALGEGTRTSARYLSMQSRRTGLKQRHQPQSKILLKDPLWKSEQNLSCAILVWIGRTDNFPTEKNHYNVGKSSNLIPPLLAMREIIPGRRLINVKNVG